MEDVSEGFQMGTADFGIDKAMIVTNARYSEHAVRYGACRGILQIGWNFPPNRGLDNKIDQKKLHPLSCLKGLRVEDRLRLADFGFVFIKHA